MTVPAEHEEVVRELFPGGDTLRAHARVCAVETKPGEVLPGVPSFLVQARAWGEAKRVKASAFAAKPGHLLHAQPPTFYEAHTRHLECAAHYRHRPVRGARIAFGAVHNATVKPALNYIEWATASPLGLAIHVVLVLAIWLAFRYGGKL